MSKLRIVASILSKEGYNTTQQLEEADLVLVNMNQKFTVVKDDLLYQCGWSPFEGTTFGARICKTFVNGNLVYDKGKIIEGALGKRLTFER